MTAAGAETRCDFTQEVRIASVMFGGVSLAIYMNGITQELLSAVRSTAPELPPQAPAAPGTRVPSARAALRRTRALLDDTKLRSTETVYRKLGRSLHQGRQVRTAIAGHGPLRTRIVVDLLAGTSAGGINAVFLAKALANNYTLDELKHLWMTEADIDTLLNDSGSDPATYPTKQPATSLLNSQRMYGLLLNAFENMDGNQAPGKALADEIDLFVTTTDLNGVATPVQLADSTIEERIHKASFHFVYGPGRAGSPDDFTKDFNPMLAFAARCTSSFPIAFEPMKLADVDERVPGLSLRIGTDRPVHRFRKFFAQFERNLPGLSFVQRPLADGGYLNNKPFSFVTDQVKVRTASMPVARKLLFLDPFPELDSQVRHTRRDVDFIENTLDAASTLPRYQTIREDIRELNNYTRAVRAAQTLASEIRHDLPDQIRACASETNYPSYETRGLRSMQAQHGRCYYTYHRLRVSAVTTDLAGLVTRLIGLEERSDQMYAIRMLIHAWRSAHYSSEGGEGKQTENYFLFAFDLGFRYRRADYVRHSIDHVLKALATGADDGPDGLKELLRTIVAGDAEAAVAAAILRSAPEEAVEELYRLRDVIEDVKSGLLLERERLLLDPRGLNEQESEDPLRNRLMDALLRTGLGATELRAILRPVRDEDDQAVANALYEGRAEVRENISQAAALVEEWLREILTLGSKAFVGALRAGDMKTVKGIVGEFAHVQYMYFDCYDIHMFTALQDQLAGEGAPVEIYRVSPFDAFRLRTASDPAGERKLAGTALFAFGAFLDGNWRANDMMWGRLDGAERIISALLPDEDDEPARARLCAEAFEIILEEEFTPHRCADLIRPLMDYLEKRVDIAKLKAGRNRLSAEEFLEAVRRDTAENCPALIQQILRSIANDSDRLAMFKAWYVKPANPETDVSLERLRRALRIFRTMLQGLDGGEGPYSKIGGPIADFAASLTRFAEFSVPQSWANVFLRYWVQVIYLVAAVLIAVGALVYKDAETAGWVVLVATAVLNVVSWLIGRRLRGAPVKRKAAGIVAAFIVLVVLVTALLVRFRCDLPQGAWKAPINAALSALDHGCTGQSR